MPTNKSRIPEEVIYRIWHEKDYSNGFTTADGLQIEIIDPGQRNVDLAGPDFHNAKVRIGTMTFSGDIEIDNFHSDWRSHGHHLNKNYNKLVLHVALSEESHHGYVITQSGRKVHSIILEKYLNETISKKLVEHFKAVKIEDKIRMPCIGLCSSLESEFTTGYIKEFGLLRHRKKCERILYRLKELILLKNNQLKEPVLKYNFEKEIRNRAFSSDEFTDKLLWKQILYEMIFEALGYSKNKNVMLKLSNSVSIQFLSSMANEEKSVKYIESVLFNVSGLLPEINDVPDEETAEYLRQLVECWTKIRTKYDGESFFKTDWSFFRLRPQNFPTVRIAAGARIINLILQRDIITRLINLFESTSAINTIISKLRNAIIIKGDGYWSNHFNFNKPVKSKIKYFLGLGRADEIIINIILPLMSVYFDLFDNKIAAERVLNVYMNYKQKEGNKLIDDMSEVLCIQSYSLNSIIHQGMIELFRNYCIKQRCLECKIGEKVFN
jgi:hypothetical protein